jgi:hypothetical protein
MDKVQYLYQSVSNNLRPVEYAALLWHCVVNGVRMLSRAPRCLLSRNTAQRRLVTPIDLGKRKIATVD